MIHCVNFGDIISATVIRTPRKMPSAYCFLKGASSLSVRASSLRSIGRYRSSSSSSSEEYEIVVEGLVDFFFPNGNDNVTVSSTVWIYREDAKKRSREGKTVL